MFTVALTSRSKTVEQLLQVHSRSLSGSSLFIAPQLEQVLDDGSHSIPDDLFIENQENTNEKYFEIFKKIFLETGHQSHYDMMMPK